MSDMRVQAAPALELEVLGAEPALHVASPALHFRLRGREPAQIGRASCRERV